MYVCIYIYIYTSVLLSIPSTLVQLTLTFCWICTVLDGLKSSCCKCQLSWLLRGFGQQF